MMRRNATKALALFLLLALASAADATIRWVDLSGTGAGAANGASLANYCAGITDVDCTPSAGDYLYLCNTTAVTVGPANSGSAGNPITYDFTCPGGSPGRFRNTGANRSLFVNAVSYLTYYGLDAEQAGTTECVLISASNNIVFYGGDVGPCSTNGFNFDNAGANAPDQITLDNIEVHDCGAVCVNLFNGTGAGDYADTVIQYSRIHDCGATGSANSRHCIRFTVADGAVTTITGFKLWNNTISGAYEYGVVAGGIEVAGPHVGNFINPVIAYNTLSNNGLVLTTGGAGNIYNATCSSGTYCRAIYRNLITRNVGNFTGLAVQWSRWVQIDDNEASDNNLVSTQVSDGFGFAIWNDADVKFQRNKMARNRGLESVSECDGAVFCTGMGLISLSMTTSYVIGNTFDSNRSGIFIGPGNGATPTGNVIAFNTFKDQIDDGIGIRSNIVANVGTFKNNIFLRNGESGIDNRSGIPQTEGYNDYFGNAFTITGQAPGAGDMFVNPGIDMDMRPNRGAAVCKAGVFLAPGYLDKDGIAFGAPPDMGAYRCRFLR